MSHATSATTLNISAHQHAEPVSGTPGEAWKPIFLIRQPIFDMMRQTVGYELIAQADRMPTTASATQDLDTLLTRQSIHQAIHVIGLDALLGQARLFIPMTVQNLLNEDFSLLPPDRTCLKLPDEFALTPQLAAICQRARQSGFSFAVDSVMMQTQGQQVNDMAQFTRVHLEQASEEMVQTLVKQQASGGAAVLATGIDSPQAMDKATRMGMRYVQGYFFCEPEKVQGKELASTQSIQLKFLAQLNKPALDFDELQETIKCDVSLTCNLLRYMNSAALGVKSKITSVKQALVLLGEKPMRQWGSLIAITALAGDQPHELLVTSLVRARFCETLAKRRQMDDQALDMFLTGLLSTLDVMLETTMEDALASVPVPQQVREVLAGDRSSVMGQVFSLVCAAERGAWGSVFELGNQLHLPHHEMASLYYQTLQWTNSFFNEPAKG